jgi:hypothetical protein
MYIHERVDGIPPILLARSFPLPQAGEGGERSEPGEGGLAVAGWLAQTEAGPQCGTTGAAPRFVPSTPFPSCKLHLTNSHSRRHVLLYTILGKNASEKTSHLLGFPEKEGARVERSPPRVRSAVPCGSRPQSRRSGTPWLTATIRHALAQHENGSRGRPAGRESSGTPCLTYT